MELFEDIPLWARFRLIPEQGKELDFLKLVKVPYYESFDKHKRLVKINAYVYAPELGYGEYAYVQADAVVERFYEQ